MIQGLCGALILNFTRHEKAPKKVAMNWLTRIGLGALCLFLALAKCDAVTLTGDFAWVHDPSRFVFSESKYYLFTTGELIPTRVSRDGIHWEKGASVLEKVPDWMRQQVPRADGKFVWAPDIIRNQNQWWLFYSYSTFGSQTSAIGLLSNSTLNPQNPNYKWSDLGLVLATDGGQKSNAIDPAPIFDEAGRLWISYGSWDKGGIKVVQLDKTTGKPVNQPQTIAAGQATGPEAPYLYFRGGTYYLFENEGFCCKGANSTYRVMMGRAKTIGGPYLDKEGVDLARGGGSVFLDSDGVQIGPGHVGIASYGGVERVSMHYYDGQSNGVPTLGIQDLVWDKDGWPVALPAVAGGRYALINKASGLALGVHNRSGEDGAPLDQFDFNGDAIQKWNVVPLGDGFYGFQSLGTGKWLDLFECDPKNGGKINQQPWFGSACQRWRVEAVAAGFYRLTSQGGATALTLPDDDKTPRALMQGEAWNGADGQEWELRKLAD